MCSRENNEKVRNNCDNVITKVSKETTIGQIVNSKPELRKILEGFGLHCLGCPMSQMETLDEACEAHGIDSNLLLQELNNLKDVEEGCGCGSKECTCGDDCDCTPEDNCGCDCGNEK